MSRTVWIVQKNLGDPGDLLATLDTESITHVDVNHIPFSDDLPHVACDGPVICYGATGFIANVQKTGRWQPGAFFDPDLFRYSVYIQQYGKAILNHSARLTTMAAFGHEGHHHDELFFVRPDADLKEFSGSVIEYGEFQAWYDQISAGGYLISPTIPIIVAEPVKIDCEWRLFVVDGEVVAATQYRENGRLKLIKGCPFRVVSFVEDLIRKWTPAPVAVYDVAQTPIRLGLVEINCFNSAGFYKADIACIVKEVTRYVDRTC